MDESPRHSADGGPVPPAAPVYRRHYAIGGITLAVESPLPILATTFAPNIARFAVDGPGPDTVVLRHHFAAPDSGATAVSPRREAAVPEGAESSSLSGDAPVGGDVVYRTPPWVIRRCGDTWVYEGVSSEEHGPAVHLRAVFDRDHASGDLYHPARVAGWWRAGGLGSLTLMPSDQIVLARLLADREACLLHAAGVALDGEGLVFVGHSDAGKSTTVELLRGALGPRVIILCDDRVVVRRRPEGFVAYGTWSHGDVPDVAPGGVPLRAVLFLEQATTNALAPLTDRGEAWRGLLATLVRPLETADWWRKELDVLERLVAEAPYYRMRFDRGGAIVAELERLASSRTGESGATR